MPRVEHRPNLLLQALPEAEFEALRPHLEVVNIEKRAILIANGAPATHVYLPHAGAVSMVVGLSDGQTVQVAMVGRESIVGASAALGDEVSMIEAVVALTGTASAIEVEVLRAAANRSSMVRRLLARHQQALHMQVQQSAACNASHSVEARLSRWLLCARDLHDGETLSLTQEALARAIGVQRNAISMVAHALREAGIIGYSRGKIEIRDLEALRATSCGCYDAVRARQERLIRAPH
jgi:CRP-like cAMP-binding protein